MARILFIQSELPEKTFGGRKRAFHLTEALTKAGHQLQMLVVVAHPEIPRLAEVRQLGVICHPVILPGSDTVAPPTYTALEAVPRKILNIVQFRWNLIKMIVDPLPGALKAHWLPPLRHGLIKLLQNEKFDLIIVGNEENALLMEVMPPEVPIILDAPNVLSSMAQRGHQFSKHKHQFSLFRIYEQMQFKKLQQAEHKIIARYNLVLVMSELEAKRYQEVSPANCTHKIRVIENGVDIAHYQCMKLPQGRDKVTFTGLMNWEPNADAMRWFLQEMWPLVVQARPQAHLDIVGAEPPSDLYHLAQKFGSSVHITGWVDDVIPYLEDADVLIAPLRLGGGTRLKILEAAAMQRPMVSTTMGAEGIDCLKNNEHLLLRDTPETFAAAVVELLTNQALSQQLTIAAREVVVKSYNWSVLGGKLNAMIETL